MMRILLAGGGTGGHIYPGLAVAEELRENYHDVEIAFACTNRGIDGKVLENFDGEIIPQPIVPFSVNPIKAWLFWSSFKKSRRLLHRWFREHPADAVLGLGGFGSIAALVEAKKFGVRRGIFNPDLVPGRANRWLGRHYAEKIFVQWQESSEFFGRVVDVSGVPLRKSIVNISRVDRNEAYLEFGLESGKNTLLILGGSSGARSLNRAAVQAIERLKRGFDSWQILHITGEYDLNWVKDSYAGLEGICAKVIPFTQRMDLAWSIAEIVISRAGAITLAEIASLGIASILLPYPYHRDNHQRKNAEVLARRNGAKIIEDDGAAGEWTVGRVCDCLHLLMVDDNLRGIISESARGDSNLNSSEKICRWLMGR